MILNVNFLGNMSMCKNVYTLWQIAQQQFCGKFVTAGRYIYIFIVGGYELAVSKEKYNHHRAN